METKEFSVETFLIDEGVVVDLKVASIARLEGMGGKASSLAQLLQNSFPVPAGISIFSNNLLDQDWQKLFQWIKNENAFPVAVRSSAQGEDGKEISYAGQFRTFLNIASEADLREAIQNCFDSVQIKASQSYAAHFKQEQIPMRVLVQKMIQPKFSGVFFSHDPRNQKNGWMIEAVEGLGEKLVSGQVTPYRFFESQTSVDPVENWDQTFSTIISGWARKIEKHFGYQIDMEWAIDHAGQFWILQVRPITTTKTQLNSQDVIKAEVNRLTSTNSLTTAWDGHSFAELPGVPSELTFQIWQKAFLPDHAFDKALKDLGYIGFTPKIELRNKAPRLLERVFGRSYLNLTQLEPMYFGESPYEIIPFPRPHLEFKFKKLSLKLLLKAPQGIFRMLSVAWKIQTQRKELANKARALLNESKYKQLSSQQVFDAAFSRDLDAQKTYVKNLISDFTEKELYGSFLITLLLESTTQGLLAILEKDLGKEQAKIQVQHFLGENLKTISTEMSESLHDAHDHLEGWNSFIKQFGHRGLGELDLARPRWIESKFISRKNAERKYPDSKTTSDQQRESVLKKLSTLRKPIFLQELQELQLILQLREEIKMHIMKPYADLRWSLLALADKRSSAISSNDIFWIGLDELTEFCNSQSSEESLNLKAIVQKRKDFAKIFKSIELPMSFTLNELNDLLKQKPQNHLNITQGVSLSPGIVSGVVHIVLDAEKEQLDTWPENTILVTEATDPAWTPLFEKAKGIIVSKGGILSHCAIVAREMGLPAVGEVFGATDIFKEGEYVWVDGINGTIRRTK